MTMPSIITVTTTLAFIIPSSSSLTSSPRKFVRVVQNNLFQFLIQLVNTMKDNKALKNEIDDTTNGSVYIPIRNSMKGKIVLITGGSSGLGLESAKRLTYYAGATVIITARTQEKCNQAVQEVKEYCRERYERDCERNEPLSNNNSKEDRKTKTKENNDVYGLPLDFDDFVNSVAHSRCDNAGAGFKSKKLTMDGYERTFQSCHLGHFLLTACLKKENLLNDDSKDTNNISNRSKKATGSTTTTDDNDSSSSPMVSCLVINVSSLAHQTARLVNQDKDDDDAVQFGLDFNNLNSELEFSSGDAYGQNKLANVLFTKEIQRRASSSPSKSWLKAVSLEPGVVVTDIWRDTEFGYDPRTNNKKNDTILTTVIGKLISNVFYRCLTPVERGANVQIWLACEGLSTSSSSTVSSDNNNNNEEVTKTVIEGGQHYDEFLQKKSMPNFATNVDDAKQLWKISEEFTKMKFDL
eukprot:CAMPEP_0170834518 /NCGR_PEP_ID=MMETSP0734-20130129/1009_1 /TAXON_ID=186038 /ORGANISM="Fragilariopsis kerguelensis, Strain L26-C5" /LENGTH=465 /DNA_ID=CAMNT_0011201109 /DNA_START=135 /DNA_END=1533 /DNA_ORIENTATION=+